MDDDALLRLTDVSVRTAEGAVLVGGVTWVVRPGEHWALLGPNGAGKSTLLTVASAQRHPSTGAAEVLGQRFGATDLRELRARVGVVDHALRIPSRAGALDVVLTGASGSVHLARRYADADHDRARELLDLVGCSQLAERPTATWSHGERARVRLARALMPAPALLLLDEPASGLDLPGREDLVGALVAMARSTPSLATVLVSHHVEELPSTTTHALLLRRGVPVAQGPATEVITDAVLSRCFDRPVAVTRHGGRWAARVPAHPLAAE